MSESLRINVGKNGINGLIAQADTQLTLDNWFESSDERTFIIKFSDYCAYLATYGRENCDTIQFSQAYKIMEMLTKGDVKLTRDEVNKIVTACYCSMLRDIGVLLIKESCLYARKDSDWKEFNIEV